MKLITNSVVFNSIFFHNTLLVLVITQKESKSVECNAFYLQCAFKEI